MISRSGGSSGQRGFDLRELEGPCPRDPPRIGAARGRRARVHDDRRLPARDQAVQLVGRDPGHAQHAVEPAPLPVLPGHEDRQPRGEDDDGAAAEGGERIEDAVDRPVKDHPEHEPAARPQEGAAAVPREKRQEARACRAGERRRHRRKTRNELGEEQRREPEAVEERLGLMHAGVGRQRDAAEGAQHPVSLAPAELVPAGVGDQACDQRREEDLRSPRASPAPPGRRPRSGSAAPGSGGPPARAERSRRRRRRRSAPRSRSAPWERKSMALFA